MDFFEQRDAKYAELGAKCREGLFFHAARHVLEDAMPTSPQAKNIAASMLRSGLHLCEVREPDSYHDFLNWVGRRIFEEQYELPWKNEVWHWKDSDLLEGSPYLEAGERLLEADRDLEALAVSWGLARDGLKYCKIYGTMFYPEFCAAAYRLIDDLWERKPLPEIGPMV